SEAMDGRRQAHMDVLVAVFGRDAHLQTNLSTGRLQAGKRKQGPTSPPVPESTSGENITRCYARK
ncbi:MAG: hypothetical protein ACTHV7_14900, partial [Oleiphilaceae bacterium]